MRTKVKVRTSMVGSSDPRRLRAKKAILVENHEEFTKSTLFMSIQKSPVKVVELNDDTIVSVLFCGKYIPCQYGIVRKAKYTNYKTV